MQPHNQNEHSVPGYIAPLPLLNSPWPVPLTSYKSGLASPKQLRHRREVPMLIVAGIVDIGAVIYWASLLIQHKKVTGYAAVIPAIFVLPFLIPMLVRLFYWGTISNGVEITPTQFSDLFVQYANLASEMGFTDLPRLYLINGMGMTNAFASKCSLSKSFVVITSDLLDAMYEFGDVNAVRFVLAHELGHIKMKHVSFWRFVLNAIPNQLLIGKSVTRAQEYTADRVAMHYAPEGASSLLLLYAGKRLYRRVNLTEYFRSFETHKIGFWARLANGLSTHPVGYRRMRALWEMTHKGLEHHGKML
jgi:Zn-dependent protease with chaperone function